MTDPVKIAVLVSGGGTNLQALIDAEASGALHSGRLSLVISSREGALALERAARAGIPSHVVTRAACGSQKAFEEQILKLLREYGIELIVLAGFMSILSADFTAAYPNRILNVHPSLIPSFCGKGFYGLRVHEAVLYSGYHLTGQFHPRCITLEFQTVPAYMREASHPCGLLLLIFQHYLLLMLSQFHTSMQLFHRSVHPL